MGGLGTALLDLCSLFWFDQMGFAEQAGTKKGGVRKGVRRLYVRSALL